MPDATIRQCLDNAVVGLQQNDTTATEHWCRQALALDARNAEALHFLGIAARRRGRPGEGIALMREAVRLAPEQPEYANNFSALLCAAGYPAEAVAVGAEALDRHPLYVYLHVNQGVAHHTLGNEEEAAAAFRQAVSLAPQMEQAHFGLGCALESLGRYAEAEQALRALLALSPHHGEGSNLLGRVLSAQGFHAEACAAFQRAVASAPQSAPAYNNLGSTLLKLGQPQEALAALRRSLDLDPNNAQAHNNAAVVCQELVLIDQAIAYSRRAVALDPANVDAHWCLSLQLLTARQWQEGWAEYEWRWQLPYHRMLQGPPVWQGQRLGGHSLLVCAEQGQGDTLQFLRYIPRLRPFCSGLIVRVQSSLKRLVADSFADVTVLDYADPIPPVQFQIPLMSLPRVLGTNSDADIPHEIPYLAPHDSRVAVWRARWAAEAPARRIGIAWRGSATYKRDHLRSVSLEMLRPLLEVPGTRFYALHPDLNAAERDTLSSLGVTDLSKTLVDFADTAALLASLDLVISVDTSAVHLAGALGRDAWVLLPFSGDWRWGTDQAESVWYPSLRLFRQSEAGNWDTVIAALRVALTTTTALPVSSLQY